MPWGPWPGRRTGGGGVDAFSAVSILMGPQNKDHVARPDCPPGGCLFTTRQQRNPMLPPPQPSTGNVTWLNVISSADPVSGWRLEAIAGNVDATNANDIAYNGNGSLFFERPDLGLEVFVQDVAFAQVSPSLGFPISWGVAQLWWDVGIFVRFDAGAQTFTIQEWLRPRFGALISAATVPGMQTVLTVAAIRAIVIPKLVARGLTLADATAAANGWHPVDADNFDLRGHNVLATRAQVQTVIPTDAAVVALFDGATPVTSSWGAWPETWVAGAPNWADVSGNARPLIPFAGASAPASFIPGAIY